MTQDEILAQYGPPDELLLQPADAFVEDFVGADRALKHLALHRVADADLDPLPGDGSLDLPRVPRTASLRDALSAILAEGGAKPEHLVRLTWYVADIEEYLANLKALGKVYREIFGAHYPAMALVEVVRLVELDAKVEIEATAVVPE